MRLSIVTTMYYSSPYLQEFYQRVSNETKKITDDYEIIFVDDGSPDNSLEVAVSLYKNDEKVKVIELSRNFGHHKAMMTGLAHTQGDLVFLIDCDLEEEPELLSLFYQKYQSADLDVVYGVQEKRKGNFFEQLTGNIFYWLFNLLANYQVPANVVTARLMSQRYTKALVQHQEREIFLLGLWQITGFKQIGIKVNKSSKGTSTYDLRKKISLLVNAITSFSNQPLKIIFYLGFLISITAIIAAIFLMILRQFFTVYLSGWVSVIVSIWFFGGLNIFCMGIIGIYIAKIFTETKQRPYTIIREIYEHC